ncbi:P-type conjugative transfer protein TrbL [Deltaproteobacteria bacterium OttesenSCG-928-M10]|nr:P-type conjugative transfer protein TrbL [Deltaproteobacteria bacterium OttesenSCG-928-M10]
MRKLFLFSFLFLILVSTAAPALAQDNIASSLLGRFVSQTNSWWGILKSYALFLFTTTLIIEVCLFGIRMALQRSDIAETLKEFVMLLLFAGFVAAVINNYQEWTTGIAINGLKPLTGQLTGNSVDAGQPVAMAAAIMEKIMPVMKDADIWDFGHVYLYVTCMLVIMVIFVLISALVILITCEFYIVANIGVLIVGLGGSKIFKDYAVNVMRYVFAVAVKLFVLQLIVNIGFAIISLSDLDAMVGSTIKSIKFVDLFFLIGKAIILLALAKSLPETCAGIINGSAIGGGNPLASMAKTAGVMAVGAASAGAGYMAGAASSLKNARSIAKDEGAEGFGQVSRGMARAAWNARRDAKAATEQKKLNETPGSIRNQLASQANAARANRLLREEAASASTDDSGQAATGITPPPTAPGSGFPDSSAGSAVGGTGAPGGAAISVGGSGQTAPVGGNAGGFGAADPNMGTTGSSGHSVPFTAGAEGSGSPAPQAASTEAGNSGPSVSPASPSGNTGGSGQTAPGTAAESVANSSQSEQHSTSSSTTGSGIPAPKIKNGTVDFTGSSPKGERDMRTVDPELFKKAG